MGADQLSEVEGILRSLIGGKIAGAGVARDRHGVEWPFVQVHLTRGAGVQTVWFASWANEQESGRPSCSPTRAPTHKKLEE